MRHSKSSWNEHNINDFERPLSKRGMKDIKLIIAFLKKKKITFDLACVSSSKRTKQTFKILKNDTLLKINWIYFDNDNLDEMKKKIKSIMF